MWLPEGDAGEVTRVCPDFVRTAVSRAWSSSTCCRHDSNPEAWAHTRLCVFANSEVAAISTTLLRTQQP